MSSSRISINIDALLAPWREFLGDLHATIQKAAADFYAAVRPLAEFYAQFKVAEQSALRKMTESGWVILPQWPIWLYIDIITAHADKPHGDSIGAIITGYYTDREKRNLDRHYEMWMQVRLFQPWRTHLRDAIDAHYRREYTLSVPAALLIADGICHRALHTPIHGGTAFSKFKDQFLLDNVALKKAEITPLRFFEMLVDRFCIDSNSTRSKTRKLNRHGIMHGKIVRYNRAQQSTRSFVLLDIIYVALNGTVCR